MPDNLLTGVPASTIPAGTSIATRVVTYSGDANQHLAPVALVVLSGADDAKVATDISAAAPLPVRLAINDVGSIVETDDGSVAGGQANVTPTIGLPYIWNGVTWTRGGCTPFHLRSAASNNATSLKATPGVVGMVTASNTNASQRFVKFYNKASAPAPATDNALLVGTFIVPGNTTGGGTNIPIPLGGLAFSTGIAFAIVAGESDTDNTSVAAGDLHLNVGYL